jgi:hypothetical protein
LCFIAISLPEGLGDLAEGEEDGLMAQLEYNKEEDEEYIKKSVEWNSFEDQKPSHVPIDPVESDDATDEKLFQMQTETPTVVRRRLGILSFSLKQIYLSEYEIVADMNNPDAEETGMQKYHKTRCEGRVCLFVCFFHDFIFSCYIYLSIHLFHFIIMIIFRMHSRARIIDIPPNWLLEFKRVHWPDYSGDLQTLVPHMPGNMVFETKSGENDELRRMVRNGASLDPNNE